MSAGSIKNVNSLGTRLGNTGKPKDTSDGMDLGKNATNSRGKISKTKENRAPGDGSASCMGNGHYK